MRLAIFVGAPVLQVVNQYAALPAAFDVARFFHNPKRQRGILLRSPQSENPLRRLIQRHGRERRSSVRVVSSAIPR